MALQSYKGTVHRAVDGDTFQIYVDLGFDVIYHARIRINGVDCPEKDPESTNFAKAIEGKKCSITIHGIDKYGRHISDLMVDKKDYATALLDAGLAKPLPEKFAFDMSGYDAIS